MSKAHKQKKPISPPPTELSDEDPDQMDIVEEEEKEYVVQEILAERKVKNQKQFLIRWEGYSSEWDTWEPFSTVKVLAAYDEWLKGKKENVDTQSKAASQSAKGKGKGRRKVNVDAVETPVESDQEDMMVVDQGSISSSRRPRRASAKFTIKDGYQDGVDENEVVESEYEDGGNESENEPSDYDAMDEDDLTAEEQSGEEEPTEPSEDEESYATKGKARKSTAKAKKPTAKVRAKAGSQPEYKPSIKPCGLKIKPLPDDLPPISTVKTMFDDIVSRLPDLKNFFGEKGARKLRVATMCSGTESPLLALGLIGRAIKERGWGELEIEHVFSCEIEPYKQA